ncbi:hypothetical protein ACOMHN_040908 [Nucella lapillus]
MELSGIQKKINFRVTLTHDTHMPIYEQLWGETGQGEQFIQTLSFYNVSLSKEIPAVVFNPPPFVTMTQTT